MGEQVRRQQVPVIGAGQGVASFVHIEDAASATVTALECAPGPYNIVDDSASQQRVWLQAFARWSIYRIRHIDPGWPLRETLHW